METIIFQHTLPHLIIVIIDTISLLYQVFTTDYQDNCSLLQDCQVHRAASKLGITVQERNTHFVIHCKLAPNLSDVFMFTPNFS